MRGKPERPFLHAIRSLTARRGIILITLSENDQHKHYPVSSPDPAEAIKFRMAQADLKPAVCSDKLYRLTAKKDHHERI
ncbi:hypothetical protein N5923_17140 [Erwiniaceae bacterium BAC15a-03b]|uniref:Uncharacterized protein n=1 Tax=Winslowiella arboricola TaxID=2978220 RepID=A0A9J6PP65_9GAMM|nr:hypothetical protein [Winslowiella arboricola]MCU5773324.1 hypothetical protein [Winslowiella arboricola]MCU5779210.1 hypothetical protein [Winslowiella arboricola]